MRRAAKTAWGLAAAVVAVALAGCLPATTGQQSEAIPLPLSGPEISKRLSGNSIQRNGIRGLAKWEYASYHDPAGTLSARLSWFGGTDAAKGRWEVTHDDLYCRRWLNHWAQGERGCFRVFASRTDGTLVFDHVSGHPGDSKQYIYKVLVGNPYKL